MKPEIATLGSRIRSLTLYVLMSSGPVDVAPMALVMAASLAVIYTV